MDTCLISKRVKIPKQFISKNFVEKELIISAPENDTFSNRQPMTLFRETNSGYIVPAMFGLKYIKKYNLKYKDLRPNGDTISVSFNGSLRENQIEAVKKQLEY